MTLAIPLWTLIPAALVIVGLCVLARKRSDWDFVSPIAGVACLAGAALFLLGRWFSR